MTLWPDQIAYPPRGMSRDEAARYVGVSTTTFDRMVQAGWMPRPKRVFSRLIWDRLQLDAAFTDLSEQQANPLDRIFTTSPGPKLSATELSHAALEQAREALRRGEQQRVEDEWEAKYEARKAAESKARPPRGPKDR
ncbi:helix-turn-helix transcriptional regulator [Bradyrhizobium sp. 1.29L]